MTISKRGDKMTKTIALLGAFDTKGKEYAFVKDCIESHGLKTFLINVGVLDQPDITPDVDNMQVAQAGGGDIAELQQQQDRGKAMSVMSAGIAKLLPQLYSQEKFDGILALGGTGGTSVACSGMRELPLGVPKVMVSTIAGSDVSAYVGVKDIVMVPSIVDVSGINKISREVFAKASVIICGMVQAEVPQGDDKPLIAASMFGNTTPAVEHAKSILEGNGYEVLVFHCTGTGGKTMESLIEAGLISGVLDLTTTEWADELVGGVFAAGPTRLEAAAKQGVPAIVTPACLDMVNFWAPDTVPAKFEKRTFYPHNPNVTLMRTTVEECHRLGEIMAEKLNQSTGPVTVLIPQNGWSMIDAPGQPFWLPEADAVFAQTLKEHLRDDITVIEIDCNVNDEAFSTRCANELLANLKKA
jgi:uncharacterized protein (UPF0261 family)